MQMFHGTPIIQSVGMGLQLGSNSFSVATSFARRRAYLKGFNEGTFHARGLHVEILGTGGDDGEGGVSGGEVEVGAA